MPIFRNPDNGDVLTVTGPNAKTLLAQGWAQVGDDPPPPEPVVVVSPAPAKGASKDDWVAYAISRGVPSFEADAATKAELIDMVS